MIDKGEADDKIIAVLENDPSLAGIQDLKDLPVFLKNRIEHYFLTYKQTPAGENPVKIEMFYDRKTAELVITAALKDYASKFPKKDE
jgi:inorganic pyrophosphatase